jgi:hypothetical protein
MFYNPALISEDARVQYWLSGLNVNPANRTPSIHAQRALSALDMVLVQTFRENHNLFSVFEMGEADGARELVFVR